MISDFFITFFKVQVTTHNGVWCHFSYTNYESVFFLFFKSVGFKVLEDDIMLLSSDFCEKKIYERAFVIHFVSLILNPNGVFSLRSKNKHKHLLSLVYCIQTNNALLINIVTQLTKLLFEIFCVCVWGKITPPPFTLIPAFVYIFLRVNNRTI